jgi:sugar lactone lactonase YvrE
MLRLALSFFALCGAQETDGQGVFYTILGNGDKEVNKPGWGLPAAAASFDNMQALACSPPDCARLYFSDGWSRDVRFVEGGAVARFLGAGAGSSTPDGPMAATNVVSARALVVSPASAGDVFYADCIANTCLVRLANSTTGLVTTLAGGGSTSANCFGPALGDGAFAGGNASCVALNGPTQLALDWPRRVLYLADTQTNRVRAINLASGAITTFAGGGGAGFTSGVSARTAFALAGPRGVAVAANGDVFVADQNSHRVLRVDAATSIVHLVAGAAASTAGFADGPAAAGARLNKPAALALTPGDGALYIVDEANAALRRLNFSTGRLATVMGGPLANAVGAPEGAPAAGASFNGGMFGGAITAVGVAFNASSMEVYVGANPLMRVFAVRAAAPPPPPAAPPLPLPLAPWSPACSPAALIAEVSTFSGSGQASNNGGGFTPALRPAWFSRYMQNRGLCLANGTLIVLSAGSNAGASVRAVSAVNGSMASLSPVTAAVPPVGYAEGNSSVARFGGNGPVSCAVAPSGVIYVADKTNKVVRGVLPGTGATFNVSGNASLPAATVDGAAPLYSALAGLALSADGAALFVADACRVRVLSLANGSAWTLAGQATTGMVDHAEGLRAKFSFPLAALTLFQGVLFVCDAGNGRVRAVHPGNGTVATWAGNGTAAPAPLLSPIAIAFGASAALAFVLDAGLGFAQGGCVVMVAGGGGAGAVYTRIAGAPAGSANYILNGPGASAFFYWPTGLALTTDGRLLVSDFAVVRAVSLRCPSPSPSPTPSGSGTASPSGTLAGSGSASPSVTPAGSGTATGTLPPTPSSTVSTSTTVSAAPTPYAAACASTSNTGSPSLSGSATCSHTPSGTPTGTATCSHTPSGTPTGTATGSATPPPTPSPTPSKSGAGSQTASPGAPPSTSPTQSAAAAGNPSRSGTPSGTPSGSPSGAPPPLPPPTVSGTPSITSTQTFFATAPPPPRASVSGTPAGSLSTSGSPTVSSSGSGSSSSMGAVSGTGSGSVNASPPAASPLSGSPAPVPSPPPSPTPTLSATGALSVAAPTPTLSATGAPSVAAQPSPSGSGKGSESASGTPPPTPSATVSGSSTAASALPTATPPAGASPSNKGSTSLSGSTTASGSGTGSPTPTPTFTASDTPPSSTASDTSTTSRSPAATLAPGESPSAKGATSPSGSATPPRSPTPGGAGSPTASLSSGASPSASASPSGAAAGSPLAPGVGAGAASGGQWGVLLLGGGGEWWHFAAGCGGAAALGFSALVARACQARRRRRAAAVGRVARLRHAARTAGSVGVNPLRAAKGRRAAKGTRGPAVFR